MNRKREEKGTVRQGGEKKRNRKETTGEQRKEEEGREGGPPLPRSAIQCQKVGMQGGAEDIRSKVSFFFLLYAHFHNY